MYQVKLCSHATYALNEVAFCSQFSRLWDWSKIWSSTFFRGNQKVGY